MEIGKKLHFDCTTNVQRFLKHLHRNHFLGALRDRREIGPILANCGSLNGRWTISVCVKLALTLIMSYEPLSEAEAICFYCVLNIDLLYKTLILLMRILTFVFFANLWQENLKL